MTWNRMLDTLAAGTAGNARPGPSRPPSPRGVVVEGSCSDDVLQVLCSRPGQQYTLRRLAHLTGRDPKRISWSLVYLRARGLISSREVSPGVAVWWAPAAQRDRGAAAGDEREAKSHGGRTL